MHALKMAEFMHANARSEHCLRQAFGQLEIFNSSGDSVDHSQNQYHLYASFPSL
jgi:hypothetical protein